MKTLPGIKIVAFFTLVFVVGLGVYAGAKDTQTLKKKHKIMVGFGWSETAPDHLNPAPHSIENIQSYFEGTNKSHRYKIQHYAEGFADGPPVGDLYICLPTPSPAAATNATSSPAAPQEGPSGSPTTGAKTQTAGYAEFDDQTDADDFIDWVNSTAPVPAKASSKSKGTKK